MNKIRTVGILLVALSGSYISQVLSQGRGFFVGSIALTLSNGSYYTLGLTCLYCLYELGNALIYLGFGSLRALEREHLYEKTWFSFMDICLAITIFREDFGLRWIGFMTLLMFVKAFHWITADRVDFLDDQTPLRCHLQILMVMGVLWTIDSLLTLFTLDLTLRLGPSMILLFCFEFFVLSVQLLATFSKYVLHTLFTLQTTWEDKSVFVFLIDLVSDFLKLVAYTLFFIVILQSYGLPLYVIRDLYLTLRSFVVKARDLIQYRKATANMNERYPTASLIELENTDRVCIVCREEMTLSPPPVPITNVYIHTLPKKLPCGHLFHLKCLKSWLERQQACPTCRRPVFENPLPPPPTPVTPAPALAPNPNPVLHPTGQSQTQIPNPVEAYPSSSRDIPNPVSIHPMLSQEILSQYNLTPIGPASVVLPNMIEDINVDSLPDHVIFEMDSNSRESAIQRLKALSKLSTQLSILTRNMEIIVASYPPPSSKGKERENC